MGACCSCCDCWSPVDDSRRRNSAIHLDEVSPLTGQDDNSEHIREIALKLDDEMMRLVSTRDTDGYDPFNETEDDYKKSRKTGKGPYLSEAALESIAWRPGRSASTGQMFYCSMLTGETTWVKPPNYVPPKSLQSTFERCTAESLPYAVDCCARYGIELHVVTEFPIYDPIYQTYISGSPPKLTDCLFYQPFLIKELSLYPVEFIRRVGIRRFVLANKLAWNGQVRHAIPVMESGTIYLDPEPAPLHFLQDVFHHELFHVVDVMMHIEWAASRALWWYRRREDQDASEEGSSGHAAKSASSKLSGSKRSSPDRGALAYESPLHRDKRLLVQPSEPARIAVSQSRKPEQPSSNAGHFRILNRSLPPPPPPGMKLSDCKLLTDAYHPVDEEEHQHCSCSSKTWTMHEPVEAGSVSPPPPPPSYRYQPLLRTSSTSMPKPNSSRPLFNVQSTAPPHPPSLPENSMYVSAVKSERARNFDPFYVSLRDYPFCFLAFNSKRKVQRFYRVPSVLQCFAGQQDTRPPDGESKQDVKVRSSRLVSFADSGRFAVDRNGESLDLSSDGRWVRIGESKGEANSVKQNRRFSWSQLLKSADSVKRGLTGKRKVTSSTIQQPLRTRPVIVVSAGSANCVVLAMAGQCSKCQGVRNAVPAYLKIPPCNCPHPLPPISRVVALNTPVDPPKGSGHSSSNSCRLAANSRNPNGCCNEDILKRWHASVLHTESHHDDGDVSDTGASNALEAKNFLASTLDSRLMSRSQLMRFNAAKKFLLHRWDELESGSLPSVLVFVRSYRMADPEWDGLNRCGFQYGSGGSSMREATAFISQVSGDSRLEPGFLNQYSTSAPEEDRAEVYAALIRHPFTMVHHISDPIIRRKGRVMMQRLYCYCAEMNHRFWERVDKHVCYGHSNVVNGMEGQWQRMTNQSGYIFWRNTQSRQVSWLDPSLFAKKDPKSLKCVKSVLYKRVYIPPYFKGEHFHAEQVRPTQVVHPQPPRMRSPDGQSIISNGSNYPAGDRKTPGQPRRTHQNLSSVSDEGPATLYRIQSKAAPARSTNGGVQYVQSNNATSPFRSSTQAPVTSGSTRGNRMHGAAQHPPASPPALNYEIEYARYPRGRNSSASQIVQVGQRSAARNPISISPNRLRAKRAQPKTQYFDGGLGHRSMPVGRSNLPQRDAEPSRNVPRRSSGRVDSVTSSLKAMNTRSRVSSGHTQWSGARPNHSNHNSSQMMSSVYERPAVRNRPRHGARVSRPADMYMDRSSRSAYPQSRTYVSEYPDTFRKFYDIPENRKAATKFRRGRY